MTFVSWFFLASLIATVTVYYIFPIKYRWYVLLSASILFYLRSGVWMLAIVIVTSLFTWGIGLLLSRTDKKNHKQRLLVTWIGVGVLVLLLVVTKIINHIELTLDWLIIPIGISYYSFSSIGYIVDIYWKKEDAESNPLKFMLFILYFPKIMQGPIEKHRELAPKLIEGHRISYQNITYGMELMLWGFFKKLVVANRAAIYVNAVYIDLENYLGWGGIYLLWISILSVVELYFDFSGYVDIATGISQMFGVSLSKNFNHPFFSKSSAEFWRRWHISLGVWFKDYVYMPISTNARLILISGKIKKAHGRRAARNFMTIIPLSVVWILTGLWHGTGLNYILWGIYWGLLIIISTVLAPTYCRINTVLHIKTDGRLWGAFQVLRTCVIYLIARIISSWMSLAESARVFKSIVLDFNIVAFQSVLQSFSLERWFDFALILIGCVILFLVSLYEEKKGNVNDSVARWRMLLRCVVITILIVAVLYLGIYGTSGTTGMFGYVHF